MLSYNKHKLYQFLLKAVYTFNLPQPLYKETFKRKEVIGIYYQILNNIAPQDATYLHKHNIFKPFNVYIKVSKDRQNIKIFINTIYAPLIQKLTNKNLEIIINNNKFISQNSKILRLINKKDLIDLANKRKTMIIKYITPVLIKNSCIYNRYICMIQNLSRKWYFFYNEKLFEKEDLLNYKIYTFKAVNISYKNYYNSFYKMPGFTGKELYINKNKKIALLLLFSEFVGIGHFVNYGFGRTFIN